MLRDDIIIQADIVSAPDPPSTLQEGSGNETKADIEAHSEM